MAFDKNEIIFDNKSVSDLFSDIYKNSKNKKKQIDDLLDSVTNLVSTVSDAAIILPMLKDVFDIAIKNDEQLVKLATVVQRIISSNNNNDNKENLELLSADEKKQLLENNNIIKQFDVNEKYDALKTMIVDAKKEISKNDKQLVEEVNVKKN
jgi:hypothetical protein